MSDSEYELIYTDDAYDRLESAIGFLQSHLKYSESKTNELLRTLLKKTSSLKKHPFKGQIEESLSILEKSHRRIVIGHFKAVYRVEGSFIYVTDFFDSRQDPKKMKG